MPSLSLLLKTSDNSGLRVKDMLIFIQQNPLSSIIDACVQSDIISLLKIISTQASAESKETHNIGGNIKEARRDWRLVKTRERCFDKYHDNLTNAEPVAGVRLATNQWESSNMLMCWEHCDGGILVVGFLHFEKFLKYISLKVSKIEKYQDSQLPF